MVNNSTDFLIADRFHQEESQRLALQREEMNANPNLRTKPKISIRRIVILALPSALS